MEPAFDSPALDRLHRHRPYHAIVNAWTEPVGLACSGGVDSTALLLLVARAFKTTRVGPSIVLHVDHRTRPETEAEQRYVAWLSGCIGVPFCGVRLTDLPVEARRESPEAYLRARRYAALAGAVHRLGLAGIVTAHTRDDQVETVLMRLFTGAGGLAAAGMEPDTLLDTDAGPLRVIRPLLNTRRDELERVLSAAGVEPLLDPTNLDPAFRRNALRQRIVPLLREIDPGFGGALLRSVDLARRDAAYCDEAADAAYGSVVRHTNGSVAIDREFLRTGRSAVTSRVLRRAVATMIGDDLRELSFERVESVRRAATGRTGAVIELPGRLVARIERRNVVVSARTEQELGRSKPDIVA